MWLSTINPGNRGITVIYPISLVEFPLLMVTHSYLFFHSNQVVQALRRMACPFDKFCLGMCDWTDCPGLTMMAENTPTVDATHTQPQPSCSSHTSNSSSTLHHERQRERFTTFINDDELAVLSKGVVPATTSYACMHCAMIVIMTSTRFSASGC